jgi:hypothetical protein
VNENIQRLNLNALERCGPAILVACGHRYLISDVPEQDMNGRHHAVVKISTEANSKIKTEHVRQLLQQGENGLSDHHFEQVV